MKRVPAAFGGLTGRWSACLLGLAGLAMAAVSLFETYGLHTSAVVCHDASCVVRQAYPFQSTQDFAFDARRPPEVIVTQASVGKSHDGRRLALRYPDGSSVELAREIGGEPDAEAARLRAYFAEPKGSLSTTPRSCALEVIFGFFFASIGLLTVLLAFGMFAWRRVGADSARHVLLVDNMLLGLRVMRRVFPVSQSTRLARLQVSPRNAAVFWLALEDPGAPARRLPFLDRPGSRALIAEMLESA